MSLGPHRVQVIVGRLRQIGVVLTHRRHGRHQRDVVPLLKAVAGGGRLIVGKSIAVVPTTAGCGVAVVVVVGMSRGFVFRVDEGVTLFSGQAVTKPRKKQKAIVYKMYGFLLQCCGSGS